MKAVFHSCKSRFCSSCGKKATDNWILKQLHILPQTQWQHITFTFPKELQPLFWLNRALLNTLMPIPAKLVETNVTHETIYRYIYSHWAIQVKFHRYLRRKHVTRMKRGERYSKVEKSLLIQYRPDKINKREEFGHWEADLMMFVKGVKENFITLVERVTRFMIAIKHKTKSPSATAMSIIRQLTPIKAHVKSITFDQGTEFFQHEWIANCLDAKIYFCNPGSPHQKGSVENRNGVLRTIFPRNYPVNQLTHAHLDVEINRINTRPMRCLSYQTPKNLFNCHSTH